MQKIEMVWSLLWMIIVVHAEVILTDSSTNITTEKIYTADMHRNQIGIVGLSDTDDVVTTEYGDVRGFQRNSGIWEFLDIPYGAFNAEQPFQPPAPPQPWTTIHEVEDHKSVCPQINESSGIYGGNEECLTLSVFVPSERNNDDVLFHIHDGSSGFSAGSGDPKMYGPEYLVPKGIILVLPNYRLGPLGFLCLQNENVPGNAGLKDLTLALKWTKDNIGNFGGNASNIVVSGSGSAAALVEYLVLSEKSQMYISKAITESGSALSHWALDRYPLETAADLREHLTSRENVKVTYSNRDILEDISLEILIEASKEFEFKPCVEVHEFGFITKTPASMLRNIISDISYMSGSANYAGTTKALKHNDESILELNNNYALLLPDDLVIENNETLLDIADRVKKQYFEQGDINMDNIEKLSLCYTDSGFLNPALRSARFLTAGGVPVYFYEFSYVNPQDPVHYSAQGQSLNYVFSQEIQFVPETDDYRMMTLMTNLWSSFIKNGKPVSEGVAWDKLELTDIDDESWLSIGEEVHAIKGIHHDRLDLWEEIYKNYFYDRSLCEGLQPSVHTMIISIVLLIGSRKNLITFQLV